MRQDDGQRARMARPDVNEVDAKAVDRRFELRPLFQLGLAAPPVVVCPPMSDEMLKFRQRRTLLPACSGRALRPPRLLEAPPQIGKSFVRRAVTERNNGVVVGLCARSCGGKKKSP